MEEIVSKGLLFDTYGDLLTGKQRALYDAAVNRDMSLSEIAERYAITRQGVSDQLNRTTRKLNAYEDALGMVRRFRAISAIVTEMEHQAASGKEKKAHETAGLSPQEVKRFAKKIRQALDSD